MPNRMTRAGLDSQVNTLLADNILGEISAADVRSVFDDVVDTMSLRTEAATWSTGTAMPTGGQVGDWYLRTGLSFPGIWYHTSVGWAREFSGVNAFSELTGMIALAQIPDNLITSAKFTAGTRGLLLPALPNTGSRDNKVPKFNGDTLGWEEDAEGISGPTSTSNTEYVWKGYSDGSGNWRALGGDLPSLDAITTDYPDVPDAPTVGSPPKLWIPQIDSNDAVSALELTAGAGLYAIRRATGGALSFEAFTTGGGGMGASAFNQLTGQIALTQIPDNLITTAKLTAAARALLLPTFPATDGRDGMALRFSGNNIGWGTIALGGLSNTVTARLLPALPTAGSRNNRVARFVNDTLSWGLLPEASLDAAVQALLLPALPNVGSRDGSALRFAGNSLGWGAIGTNNFDSTTLGRLSPVITARDRDGYTLQVVTDQNGVQSTQWGPTPTPTPTPSVVERELAELATNGRPEKLEALADAFDPAVDVTMVVQNPHIVAIADGLSTSTVYKRPSTIGSAVSNTEHDYSNFETEWPGRVMMFKAIAGATNLVTIATTPERPLFRFKPSTSPREFQINNPTPEISPNTTFSHTYTRRPHTNIGMSGGIRIDRVDAVEAPTGVTPTDRYIRVHYWVYHGGTTVGQVNQAFHIRPIGDTTQHNVTLPIYSKWGNFTMYVSDQIVGGRLTYQFGLSPPSGYTVLINYVDEDLIGTAGGTATGNYTDNWIDVKNGDGTDFTTTAADTEFLLYVERDTDTSQDVTIVFKEVEGGTSFDRKRSERVNWTHLSAQEVKFPSPAAMAHYNEELLDEYLFGLLRHSDTEYFGGGELNRTVSEQQFTGDLDVIGTLKVNGTTVAGGGGGSGAAGGLSLEQLVSGNVTVTANATWATNANSPDYTVPATSTLGTNEIWAVDVGDVTSNDDVHYGLQFFLASRLTDLPLNTFPGAARTVSTAGNDNYIALRFGSNTILMGMDSTRRLIVTATNASADPEPLTLYKVQSNSFSLSDDVPIKGTSDGSAGTGDGAARDDHSHPVDGLNLPAAPDNVTDAKTYNLSVPASTGDPTWAEATGGGATGIPDAPANESTAKSYTLNVPATTGAATWVETMGITFNDLSPDSPLTNSSSTTDRTMPDGWLTGALFVYFASVVANDEAGRWIPAADFVGNAGGNADQIRVQGNVQFKYNDTTRLLFDIENGNIYRIYVMKASVTT